MGFQTHKKQNFHAKTMSRQAVKERLVAD